MLNLASDAGLIFVAYFAALIVRFEWMKDAYVSVPLYSPQYAGMAGLYSVLMVLVYCVFRMYGSYRFKDQSSEIVTILLLNGVGALGLTSLLYLTRVIDVSRLAIFFFWAFSSGLVSDFLAVTSWQMPRIHIRAARSRGMVRALMMSAPSFTGIIRVHTV